MKEKAYYIHYQDNANSWGRMMMLFQLYWPSLKQGFITCFLYPFLVYILAVVAKKYADISLKWLLETPVLILLYAAPLMLTKRDYRQICAQLPLTAVEKLGFLLLTFLIAVPLTMEIGLKMSEILCSVIFQTHVPIKLFTAINNFNATGIKIPTTLCFIIYSIGYISVVLYYVVTAKNRAMAGILSFFGLVIFFTILSFLIGIVCGLIGREGFDNNPRPYMYASISIILLAYLIISVVYLVKLYKYLRNRGF